MARKKKEDTKSTAWPNHSTAWPFPDPAAVKAQQEAARSAGKREAQTAEERSVSDTSPLATLCRLYAGDAETSDFEFRKMVRNCLKNMERKG
jgi:hypothetical protein